MITKEQIEKAAKEWARKMSNAPDKDTPDWIECDFKAGANWALEQCPYSREDMIAFGKLLWLELEGWDREDYEIEYFIKKWEEQK